MSAPARAIQKSADRKLTTDPRTRQVAATYASQGSCPSDCIFLGNGACYANNGHTAFTTRRVNAASEGLSPMDVARAEADAIDTLKPGGPLRLHVVGDCSSPDAARIVSDAAERYAVRSEEPAWTYTHAWRVTPREAWGTVSVLASVERDADIVPALARGYAVAIVVASPEDAPANGILCPQQTGKAKDCHSCRLCMRDGALRRAERPIVFTTHANKRAANAALEAANEGNLS